MDNNATRVWYGGLTIALAVIVVFGLSSAVTAGSKDAGKGYLGVYMQELDKDMRDGLNIEVDDGVLISGVESGGPADEAGLEDGDVIIEFAGKPISDPDDLRDLARDTEPGEKVEVKVVRGGEIKTFTLTVGDWPDDASWFSMGDLHRRSRFRRSRQQYGVRVFGQAPTRRRDRRTERRPCKILQDKTG